MTRLADVFRAAAMVLKTYPALSAALLNIGVVLLSYFGLHVTGDQLMYVAGLLTFLFGVVVHSNVTPLVKLEKAVQVVVHESGTPIGGQVVNELTRQQKTSAPTLGIK